MNISIYLQSVAVHMTEDEKSPNMGVYGKGFLEVAIRSTLLVGTII